MLENSSQSEFYPILTTASSAQSVKDNYKPVHEDEDDWKAFIPPGRMLGIWNDLVFKFPGNTLTEDYPGKMLG